jgi:hypothetical protein
MIQNSEHQKQIPPAPKGRMSSFRKALLWTAIPTIVLSVISAAGVATTGEYIFDGAAGFAIVWIVAAIYLVGAILISIICLFVNRSIGAGILTGVGIGIVALGATCFANIS